MSIASEITRLQGVKADILTAIADKGVTVPAGSALDDCPDLIASIPSGGNDDVIAIGEFTYETVVIGQLRWTKKNLKSVVTGVNYPATLKWDTGAGCVYYDNDTATYGIYGEDRGLLFNRPCVPVINNWLQNNGLEGWRIATWDDVTALVNIAGGMNTATALQKLAKPQYWTNTTGMTDELGFGMMPTGRVRGGEFLASDLAEFLTDTVDQYSLIGQSDSGYQKVWQNNIGTWYDYGAIRLVKDEHGTIPAAYKYRGLVHLAAGQSNYGFQLPMNRPDNSITLEVKIRITDGLDSARVLFVRKYSNGQDNIGTWRGQYITLARNSIYFDEYGVNLSSEVGKIVDVSYGKDNFTWGTNSYSFSGPSKPLNSISIGTNGMGNSTIGIDIFSATVKDGNGNVIGNYIPVTRISDSVAGLYDSMTDTFVTAG